jgi:integrase
MGKRKWDKGLDFKQVLGELMAYKKWVRSSPRMTKQRRVALRNVNILLLALLNGLRISEAVECYYKWLEDPQQDVFNIRVAKSKTEKYRLCITRGLDSIDHKYTKNLRKPKPNNLQAWSLIRFGFNTHSLRYAFINHMLQQGYDPATVSKIIAHSKLETLLSYIQEKRAKEALLKEVERALKTQSLEPQA